MSNQYSMPLSYGNQPPLSYDERIQSPVVIKERPSSAPAAMFGGIVGLAAGSVIGAKQHPYMKNGIPTDTFAKKAYDKYMKHAPAAEQESYGQYKEVLKKLDKVKTVDELKTLINNNPKAADEISTALEKTTDEYLSTITESNLSSNKETIKRKLEAGNATRFQNMKNQITTCWDAATKKFVKPASMDDPTFKAIKKSANMIKSKFIAVWALSSAAALGIVSFIGHKLYQHKKESANQQ